MTHKLTRLYKELQIQKKKSFPSGSSEASEQEDTVTALHYHDKWPAAYSVDSECKPIKVVGYNIIYLKYPNNHIHVVIKRYAQIKRYCSIIEQ